MDDIIKITTPAVVTLKNISERQIGFVPYKENFTTYIAAGATIEIEVATAGQVLYYLSQAIENQLEVTQAAKA